MKLYHGSNVEVREPKILKSNRALDFGTAFYMTSDYEQAKKWAKLTTDRKKTGSPMINEYEFDTENVKPLNVIRYESADKEWLRFVSACRSEQKSGDEAIRRLLPFKLKDQYAKSRNTTADKVLKLWDSLQLTDFIYNMYERYHCEALDNAFKDIDSIVEERKKA
jgi:hypothetical protein